MNPFSVNTIFVGIIMSVFLLAVLTIILMTVVAAMNSIFIIIPAMIINVAALIYVGITIL